MFKPLDPTQQSVRFQFEGRDYAALVVDSVAAALLVNDCGPFGETPASGVARASFCWMNNQRLAARFITASNRRAAGRH